MYIVNLKDVCSRHGITLTELARVTSIPQPSLSRYNSGRSDITLRQLGRIALALKVTIDELVERDIITERFRKQVQALEKERLHGDKRWVTNVLLNLQQHYRRIRR